MKDGFAWVTGRRCELQPRKHMVDYERAIMTAETSPAATIADLLTCLSLLLHLFVHELLCHAAISTA